MPYELDDNISRGEALRALNRVNAENDRLRAALDAAQAAGAEWQPIAESALKAGLAYSVAIELCKDDPSMNDDVEHKADALETLYSDWVTKYRAALRALSPPASAETESGSLLCEICGGDGCVACCGTAEQQAECEPSLSASAPAGAPSEEELARLIYKVTFENLAATHDHPFDRAKVIARAVLALFQQSPKE